MEKLTVVAADKGYDALFLRDILREHDVGPMIKQREFGSIQKAHNAQLDEDIYNRWQISEAVFRVFGQRYSSSLKSRLWYRQFREITIKAAVKNVDGSIEHCYA